MEHIAKSIVVHVPAHVAYAQWTRFEEYPHFLDGVVEVRLVECARLRWRSRIGGILHDWEALICQQVPDSLIAWRSISGPPTTASVSFHICGAEETRVDLSIEHEPVGLIDRLGGALGLHSARAMHDLVRFKQRVEGRPAEHSTETPAR